MITFDLSFRFPWFFVEHWSNPYVQSQASFPLGITSRDVGYSFLGFKLLNNIGNCGHRNIKLTGEGQPLCWPCLAITFFLMSSDHSLVFHVQCDAHSGTKQQIELLSPFKRLHEWFKTPLIFIKTQFNLFKGSLLIHYFSSVIITTFLFCSTANQT